MNAYLASVLENVKTKHGNEPEFVQTVEEVLSSLEPVIEKHPEYEKMCIRDSCCPGTRSSPPTARWWYRRSCWPFPAH